MKNIVKILVLGFISGLVVSCGSGSFGEVVGYSRYDGYTPITPYGTVYIHMGSFTMGSNDDDVPFAHNTQPKTVSVPSFYIDDTEISNAEYRQFVVNVVDSIKMQYLVDADVSGDGEYFEIIDDELTGEEITIRNYDARIDEQNEEVREALSPLYIDNEDDMLYGQRVFDPSQINFRYFWVDYKRASNPRTRDNRVEEINKLGQSTPIAYHDSRAAYIIEELVNIYPDTFVWIHDFTYSYNDAMSENYWNHPAYDDYPVVGVTWGQAKAFNAWRTRLMNQWKVSRGDLEMPSFRLPTETEWEFASRGGLDLGQYPWGGPYIRNRLGCPLANFKPLRGDYVEDGGFYTLRVDSYEPNDYGLYCMAGNVAEWTSSAYDESVYQFTSELNPDYNYDAKAYELPVFKRKVIRGGSWKDVPYYLQCGTRTYEYQDSAKSYIGFRSVMSFLGRGQETQN